MVLRLSSTTFPLMLDSDTGRPGAAKINIWSVGAFHQEHHAEAKSRKPATTVDSMHLTLR